MDNFRFDLQIFADVVIDLTNSGGKDIYATIDGWPGWYTTAEYETAAAGAADPDSVAILARVQSDGRVPVTGAPGDNVSVVTASTKFNIRSFAGNTLYINSDGEISGLAPGVSFDADVSADYGPSQFTVTVTGDGKHLHVTGDRVSIYELDSSTLTALKLKIVTPVGLYEAGGHVIQLNAPSEESSVKLLEPLTLALKLEEASAKQGITFYMVDETGKVSLFVDASGNPVTAPSDLPGWNPDYKTVTLPDNVIGYFTVDNSKDGAASTGVPGPWVRVAFAGKNEFHSAEFGAEWGNVGSIAYSGRVLVDAAAVAEVMRDGNRQPLKMLMFDTVADNPEGAVNPGAVDNSMISVVGLAGNASTNAQGAVGYLFDWNGTHYFKVNMSTLEGDPPYGAAVIGEGYELAPGESSEFCLKVETKKLANGAVQITDIRSGRLDEWGYFSDEITEQANPDKLRWIYVDVDGMKGVDFDTRCVNYSRHDWVNTGKKDEYDNPIYEDRGLVTEEAFKPFIIRNVGDGCKITGGVLPVDNTVAIEFTNENVAFTVKGAACSYKDGKIIANGKTFIPVKGVGETPTICLDTTVAQGTFLLDKTNTKLTASAKPQDGKDTVMRDIEYIGSGDGVQVTVKINGRNTGGEISGVMGIDPGEKVIVKNYKDAVGSLWEKTTGEWKDGVFTKTFHSEDKNMPFDIVLTCANPTAETNLLTWRGFQMETAFDFGKTTKGSLGLFEADADGNLTIKAQPAGTVLGPFEQTKNYVRVLVTQSSGTYTIKNLELMVFNSKDAPDPDWGEWDADQLTHRYNSDGTVFVTIEAPTDGNLVLNRNGIELGDERETAWDADGHPTAWLEDFPPTFNVTNAQAGKTYKGFAANDTVAGTLGKGKALTVNGVVFTSGADGAVVIRGDGKAMFGSFALGSKLISAGEGFTKTLTGTTGTANAVVQLHDGEVIGLTGLTAGKTVTIETKNENGVLTQTETYTAKAVTGSTALDIEYKVDGVTMSTYTVPDAGTNIAGVEVYTYTNGDNVEFSKVKCRITTNGDEISIKVRDGEVIGISGLTSGHGEVAITDKITANIGSYTADGFTATGMTPNTTVKTLPLKQKQTVQFGDKKYKAGADGAITYQVTETGEVRFVDGTLKLWDGKESHIGLSKSLTTRTTDDDGNVIETQVDFAANEMPSEDTRNIVVTVKDGKVTGISSFGANPNGAGETVTITTTVTNPADPYNPTVRTETYQAEFVPGTSGTSDKIRVTCTDNIENVKSSEFADVNQNILDDSTKWTVTNQVTVQEFDWNGVGYFRASPDEKNPKLYNVGWEKDTDPIAMQWQGYGQIDGSKQGEIYLEVIGTKDEEDVATINSMRLVQVQANGEFVAYPTTKGTIGYYEIDARYLKGFNLSPSHKENVRIWAKEPGSVFEGLNAKDCVAVICNPEDPLEWGNDGMQGTITVNGKAFTVTNENGRGAEIYGDGTLGWGDFLITGTATAAAVPWDGIDLYKTLTYTYKSASGTGDGVWVSVHSDGDGGIEEVTGLDAGEHVVITSTKGNTEDISAVGDEGGVLVTRLTKHDGINARFTRRGDAETIRQTDVNSEAGYTVENLFNYGAKGGEVGFFHADMTDPDYPVLTVAQQQESDKVTFGGEGEVYFAVGATKDKTSGAVTITNMNIFAISEHGHFDKMPFFEVDKAKYPTIDFEGAPDMIPPIRDVEFVAPEGVDLTLASNAIKLNPITVNDGNDNPAKIQNGPRVVAIHVTGAQAGRSYTGFTAIDSVSGTLVKANDFITVGGKKFYAGRNNDTVEISGEGKAMNGVFRLGASFDTVGVDPYSDHIFTKNISGTATDAVLVIENGDFTGLTGLKAGQYVTFKYTEYGDDGKTVYRSGTLTYSAAAGSDTNHLTITRTLKMNDWQDSEKITAELAKDANLANDRLYAAPHKFDWTMNNNDGGVGYFYVGNLAEEKNLGMVEIGPTSTVISEVDNYYLQMDLNGDGSVSQFSLFKFDEAKYYDEGIYDYESVNLSEITGGTLNITAPKTQGLYLDRKEAGLPDTVTVNITGAAGASTILKPCAGDSLKTATLSAGQWVTVVTEMMNNNYGYSEDRWTVYKVADKCALNMGFEKDGDNVVAKLSDGALEFTEDTTVRTTNGSYAVVANGDTVGVKVINGEVAAISGMENGSVTVTDENGNVAKYTASGVEFTTLKNGTTVTTAALKQNKDVWLGGEHYKAGADGAITYQVTDTGEVRFVDGTLRLWDGGKVPDCEKSFTARTTDVDGNVIETRVDFSANEMPGEDTRNIVVTVKDGKVTGIKSFGAHKDGAGETVTITTTVTPAGGGDPTVSEVTYQAAMVNGKIRVTRTDDLGNAAWYDFADVNQNILNASTQWNITNQVTRQDFDWNGTGYFYAVKNGNVYNLNWTSDANGFAGAVQMQDGTDTISKDDAGKVYLEVVSTKDENGIATLSSMRLVKVQAKGTFAAFTGTIGTLEIEAAGLSGINLPKHTANVRIWAKQSGVFTGLNAKDIVEVSGPWTDDDGNEYPGNPFSGKITVNGKSFEVTDEKGVRILGNGELDYGVFIIKDKATAAAVPWEGADVAKNLTYTAAFGTGDGVRVTVYPEGDTGIGEVSGLDAGEKVVITSTKGNKEDISAVEDNGEVLVTRLSTHDGLNFLFTRRDDADTIRQTAVTRESGFTAENLFDYGVTDDGKVGFFRADMTDPDHPVLTVAQQQESDKVTFGREGELYVAVGATKNKTSGAVTITNMKILAISEHGSFDEMPFFEVDKAKYPMVEFPEISLPPIRDVEFVAPEGVDLTLAANAINLNQITVGDKKDNPVTIAKGPRVVAIHVTGAQAGKRYAGLSAIDTVSANELAKNQTLIVNGVTFTAAEKDRFTVSGDGKAVIDGTFALKSGLTSIGDGFTQTITGAANAVVQFRDGEVVGLSGLANGQKVTVQRKAGNSVIRTETYTAKAVAGAFEITYTFSGADLSSQTIPYTVKDAKTNIAVTVHEYTENDNVDAGKMTYQVTTNGDTVDVIVRDGEVIGISGLTKDSDGNPKGQVTVTDTATANIGLYTADGFTATAMTPGTTVKTLPLKEDKQTVQFGGKKYKAGADGAITYQVTDTGEVRFVDGTLKVADDGQGMAATLTARTFDTQKNRVIDTLVTYTAGDVSDAAKKNATAVIKDGKVTSVTGLGAGESITLKTTATSMDDGSMTESTVTYEAVSAGGAKVKVTRTDGIGNEASRVFTSDAQNILDTSSWTIANQVTVQDFDWSNTGYFHTEKNGNVYTPETVGAQGGSSRIDSQRKDEVYLEVVSAKDENGIATVSSMRLVKVQANGTFAAFTGTIGAFEMEAYGLSGVVLPKHTVSVTIKTKQLGAFKGLNNSDVVQIESPVDGLVTVNNQQYAVKTTEAPGNFDEKCTIRGDGVLTRGVFTVTGEAAASAVPPEGARLNKSIKYSGDGDGVTISVREHWGIERVTDLEAGEEVTIFSSYQGGTSVIRAIVDPSDANQVVVTKTETYGGQTLVSTIRGAADAIRSRNVNAINDFTVTSLFDYGAANGGVGLFLVDSANKTTTVKTQTAGVTFDTDGALYLAVAATKNRNDVTINNLDVLSYDADDLLSDDQISEANKGSIFPEGCFHVESFNEIGTVDIAAPEGGNLTLKNGAINLGKTPRTAAIHVTGAQAGRSYSGFLAIDTVSTGADTLDKNQKLIVNGVTFTAAEKDRFTVSGDGKAVIDGSFAIGSKLQTAGDGFTQTISGAAKAVVQVRDGRAKKLVGLQGGQKVTIVTNEGVVVITDEFSAVAVKGSASLEITHKKNGAVVETYTILGSSYNAMGAPTFVADFDWTTETEESGTGYFLVEGLTQESLDLGTVTILPTTTMIFTSDEGSYYLKTELSADGVVSGLSLVKIDAEGHIVDSDVALSEIAKGTLNIEAPTAKGLQLDRQTVGLNSAVKLNIAGAANGSVISNLNEGDSVSTANLAAGETITLNDTITLNTQTFTAAGGVLNIECGNAEFIVKEGALQLNGNMHRVTTTGKTADGKAVRSTVEFVGNGVAPEKEGVSVMVKNGEVMSVSGLDWVDATIGEKATVTRTVGDVTTTMTYTAAKCTELGKDGWVEITRKGDATGSEWKYVTADRAENILALSENQWTITNLVTERNFDGNGVGYFLVDTATGTVETAKPQKTPPYATITGENKGEIYLKVISESKVVNEDEDEAAYITGLSFVEVQENGTFVEIAAPQNFQGITLDVDQAVGFALPPHTEKVAIINAKDENGFAGLNAADTVSGVKAGTIYLGKADKNGKFTATATFTVAWAGTDDPYTINGAGELVEGVFEVKGKATAAANPPTGHECNKSIAYTYDKAKAAGNGVVITVDDEWGIERITGLEAGETVTITGSVKGNGGVYTATDAGEGKTTVTRTETHNGLTIKYTMTGDAATISTTNVNAKNGFTVANKFDFNATKDGELGFFALDGNGAARIETQQAGVTFGKDGAKYVGVVAKKSGNMVTITHLEAISFDEDDIKRGEGEEVDEGGFENELTSEAKTLTVNVPKGLGLTLAKDAVLLRKLYDEDHDGVILREDTERTTNFIVNAEEGNSFIGFDEQDTIFVKSADKATLTVGTDTKTATKFTVACPEAAEDKSARTDVEIRGDGKALNGVFKLGTGFETVDENETFTKKITGTAKDAVLTIVDGDIASITGLAAGQNLTVTYTVLDTGVVQTRTYKAEAISGNANELKITCTQTNSDGVGRIMTAKAKLNKSANIWNDGLFEQNMVPGSGNVTYGGNFDWTMANGVAYFATAITKTNPMSKDIGVVDVKPKATHITEDNDGDVFLMVALSGNGQVGTLGFVTADENMNLDPLDPLEGLADLTGTVNFTAPAAEALELLRGGPIPDGVRLRISDAVNGSAINGLKDGDVVSTTKLKAGDTITVNGVEYTAGTADLLRVEIVGGEAALSDGTLKYEGVNSPAIRTTNGGTYSVVGDAVVKVLGGEVVSLSSLTGNVTVVDKDGNTAHYTSEGVDCDTPKNGTTMKTAALNAGDSVSVGTRTYTAGGGSLTFGVEAGAPTLVDGVLLLEESAEVGSNEAIVLSGNREITFTKVAGNSRVLVTVRNGEVASITGLHRGDIITVSDTVVGDTVYTAETNTIVTMKVGSADAVRAYMNTAGGDVVNANYLKQNAVPAEGQFSWADVSGRSTGYFAVSGNKATIAEQAAKSAVTLAKGKTATYVVANTVQPDGSKIQVLTINAIEATDDGSGTVISRTGRKLLENATLTVTAPTTAGMKYTKHDNENYHIIIDKAAAGSRIINLEAGDSLKTNTLEIGQHIFLSEDDSERYIAGAKGVLEFQGEGDIGEVSQKTTLLKGTILLDAGNKVATLSGSKDDSAKGKYNLDDNITVTAADLKDDLKDKEKVTVVADNGVVKSVTGLWSKNATVTLTVAGDMTGEKTVVYKVLRSSEDAKTGIHTALIKRTEGGEHVSYGTFTEKQSFYAAPATVIDKATKLPVYAVPKGYQALAALPAINEKELWANGVTQTVYIRAQVDENGGKIFGVLCEDERASVKAEVEDEGTDPEELLGCRYIAATVQTTNSVANITKLELVEVGVNGKFTAVKDGTTLGRVFVDGTMSDGQFVKFNKYAIPKNISFTASNVALGSSFTGLKDGDCIDTAASDGYALSRGDVMIYHSEDDRMTAIRKVTYAPGSGDKTAAIIVTSEAGVIEQITGLDKAGESVTIVETTATGTITTEYKVTAGTTDKSKIVVTKTIIDTDGNKEIKSTGEIAAADGNDSSWVWTDREQGTGDDLLTENRESRTTVFEFDWTMAKKDTGYFAVTTAKDKSTSAAVKTMGTTTLNPYTDAKKTKRNETSYLAVHISDNGVLDYIEQVRFDSDPTSENYNTLVSYGNIVDGTQFTGTINVTAPTAIPLTFDRSTVDAATIADTATVSITGAAAGSKITNLVVGDTVTTAKLNVADAKKDIPAQSVIVDVGDGTNGVFTAGAAGALSFRVEDGNVLALTGGTILLNADSAGLGGKYAFVGTKLVTVAKGDVTLAVTNNGKAYTIGDLKEGEKFTVEDFATGTVREYYRSATTLFCTMTASGQKTTTVYNINAGVNVTSAILEGKNGWLAYNEGSTAFKADNTLVSGKELTVDLAALDKRMTADEKEKAGSAKAQTYNYVVDKYMADPKKFNGAVSVINSTNFLGDLQEAVGSGAWESDSYVYRADADFGQTIKVAKDWNVVGSDKADIIIGASANSKDIVTTIDGGAGNDIITGGGATENFVVGKGRDVLKNYTTGKDTITMADFDLENVVLAGEGLDTNQKTVLKGVLLHDGSYNKTTKEAANSALLVGMAGKAVQISTDGKNFTTYYFGDGTKTKGAETFTYVEGARYYGNGNLTNTLKVATDKTKASKTALGDAIEIDLTANASDYVNIHAIDASGSANTVVLAAGETGSTLKGGSYQSTLKAGAGQDNLIGGSGEDIFWFDTVEKNDVVTGYTSGKDSLYLGDFDKEKDTAAKVNGLKVETSGNDVVFSNGDLGSVTLKNGVNTAKPVTIRTDKEGTATADYYVGKAGTYDKNGKLTKATNTFTANIGTEAEIVDGNVSLKTNYYVGNDTANDTLKLVGKDTKKMVAKVSLADLATHASSIDILDASGLTSVADSKITIEGKQEGTFTLIGSANKAVKETFDLSNLLAGDNAITLTNLDVGEVIELAAGLRLENVEKNGKVVAGQYSITDGSFNYGALTISGATKNNAFGEGVNEGGKTTYTLSKK